MLSFFVTAVLNFTALYVADRLKSKFPDESWQVILKKNEPEVIESKKKIIKLLILAYGQFIIIFMLGVLFNLVIRNYL